jgi:hypothetical protein
VSACEVRLERPDNPCGQPATARFTYGCVHEHVTTALTCAGHADSLRGRDITCQDCRQHDGHNCPLTCHETALPTETAQ